MFFWKRGHSHFRKHFIGHKICIYLYVQGHEYLWSVFLNVYLVKVSPRIIKIVCLWWYFCRMKLCFCLHVLWHFKCTRGLHIKSTKLYQVRYWASLLHQKSHTYEPSNVMQTSKCISLQIMQYGALFWGHNIILCKESRK